MNKKKILPVLLGGLLGCLLMGLVDGIWKPGYFLKSACKLAVFGGIPFLYGHFSHEFKARSIMKWQKNTAGLGAVLGLGVYVLILCAYYLVSDFWDFSAVVPALSKNNGVDKSNFLYVSLYISFVNSFLEEFFFRGFLFLILKKYMGRGGSYSISAVLFSLYHVAFMIGWFPFWQTAFLVAALVIAGLLFNLLDDKQESLYPSWLFHMFANFAINTIGFILLK